MHITSTSNQLVKDFAKLAEKKYRAESGLFWLEGAEFVARAVAAGWEIDTVLVEGDEGGSPWMPAFAGMTQRGIITTTRAILGKITGRDNPQPVLGVLKQRWYELGDVDQSLARRSLGVGGQLWLALDRVRDPGNLGTILRTADAAGVAGCVLIGEATDPFSPECVRATMGSILHVPLVRCTEAEFVAWAAGKQVVGTHLSGKQSYRAVVPANPCVVLMGNESAGLTDALTTCCTEVVRIPMVGHTESLNLATATALMLYELRKADLP